MDNGIANGTQFQVKSTSAEQFYKGIKKIHDDCVEAGKEKECCIGKLVRDGHASAALGGKEGFDKLTAQQIADLRSMFCKDATITDLGCFAFDIKGPPASYIHHLNLAMLLSENGGTYEGFIHETLGLYPDTKSDYKDEKKPSRVKIPRGANEDDVKKKFKGVDPSGQ